MADDANRAAGRIADWKAAAELPEPALRDLAASADPTERVWAAWGLALRLGRASIQGARASLATEPTPGIRCQLIVLLAGFGEHELLRTLAVLDPDATVRGTACQYVVRTAPPGAASARAFALERIRADVPRIGQAMLEEILAGRLALPDEVLADLLTRPDVETRRLTVEALEERERLSGATKIALLRLVPIEDDGDVLARAIRRLMREGAYVALLDCAAGAPEARLCLVLASLARADLRFSWRDLEPLSRRPEPAVAASLFPLLAEPLERDAFRWLCTRASDRDLEWRVLSLIYHAVSPENFDLVDARVAALMLRWYEERYDFADEPPAEPSPTDLAKKRLLESRAGIVGVLH